MAVEVVPVAAGRAEAELVVVEEEEEAVAEAVAEREVVVAEVAERVVEVEAVVEVPVVVAKVAVARSHRAEPVRGRGSKRSRGRVSGHRAPSPLPRCPYPRRSACVRATRARCSSRSEESVFPRPGSRGPGSLRSAPS